jgi:hypothetical protein
MLDQAQQSLPRLQRTHHPRPLERAKGVTNLVADRLERLSLAAKIELARQIELSGNELT